MTLDPDPYRTLGLARGASLDEVKRAYRRLAKINHPDAAGEAALPRFLAIQAAYEQLLGGPGPVVRGRRPAPAPRRPWDADPDRSDATRRAYGGRARTGPRDGDGSGPQPHGRPSGTTDGATGDPASPGRARWSSRAEAPGAASSRPGQRPSPPPRDRDGTAQPGGAGGPSASGRSAGSGRASADGRRNKATLGSTSYDGVEGPFEPDWGGASWYGTTSGTYWTLNPKEYADPRKHGPEYQARARRTARSRGAGPDGPLPDGGDPDDGPAPGPEAATDPTADTAFEAGAEPGPGPGAGPTHTTSSWWESTTGDAADPAMDTATSARRPQSTRTEHATSAAAEAAAAADRSLPPPDVGRALTDIVRALTEPRFGGLRGRVIRAVIGWLPIALGLGWVVGELTGCGRFAATCDGSADVWLLGLQVAALIVLLLVPALASVATMAALTVFAASVATAFILSATGGAADSDSRRAALGIVLLLAWLGGLSIAIGRRLRALPAPTSPVS